MPLRVSSQHQVRTPGSQVVACQLEGFALTVHLCWHVLHLPQIYTQWREYLLVDCQAGDFRAAAHQWDGFHVAAHQWEGFHVAAHHVAAHQCQIQNYLAPLLFQAWIVRLVQAPIIGSKRR